MAGWANWKPGWAKEKKFRRFAPNFAHPGLKPCRRPCRRRCLSWKRYTRRVVKVVLWSRGAHLMKPGWSKPHTHSNPTNLALFRRKIALYRFNQGGGLILLQGGGLKWEQGLSSLSPHFNYCTRQWHRSVAKIWERIRVGHFKPSNCYGRLEKLPLPSILTQVFHPWWCETCRIIQQQFWMKEGDILWGQNTPWPLLHIFRGSRPQPYDLRPYIDRPIDRCLEEMCTPLNRVISNDFEWFLKVVRWHAMLFA